MENIKIAVLYFLGFISPLVFLVLTIGFNFAVGFGAIVAIGVYIGWKNSKLYSKFFIGVVIFGVIALIVSTLNGNIISILASFFSPIGTCMVSYIGVSIGSFFNYIFNKIVRKNL